MHIMSTKKCNQCKLEKPTTEFNKLTKSKDGLQMKCKTCCKQNSKRFRIKNPNYYWGQENSYFVKNYDEKNNYNKIYYSANKTAKVYRIDFPDGQIYIGSTKRTLAQRINNHLVDYRRFTRNAKPTLPLFHKKLNDYSPQQAKKLLKSAYIVKEFDGNRTDMLEAEKKEILKLRKAGYILLNKNIK